MTRLLSGVALAGTFAALVWFAAPLGLLLVATAVAMLCVLEYARISEAAGAVVPLWPTALATAAVAAVVPFPWVPVEAVLGLALVLTALRVMLSGRSGASTLHDVAASALAPVYIGLPLGSLVAIHALAGRQAVFLLVGTIIASDSAQYYVGRAFGRQPLAPRLSPKKTREGAIGGVLIGTLTLVALGRYLLPAAAPATLAALGVLVTMSGIFGDLFESMLKRGANLKDSAALIPGHGGMLDRIDALLFGTIPFYFYLRAF